jgi:hypothetical protein
VLLPGYIYTIYYAARDDKSMPGGWLAGNIVSSAEAISVGIVSLYTSKHYNGASEGSPPGSVVGRRSSVVVVVGRGS